MPDSDAYFGTPTEQPTEPGRFVRVSDLPSFVLAEGLTLRPLVGKGQMVSFAQYEQDAEAPLHAHVEEQIFIAIEGDFEVQIDDETRMIGPGEAAVIPSWVPHRVIARNAPGFQVDVFCPPRQGLLDLLAPGDPAGSE